MKLTIPMRHLFKTTKTISINIYFLLKKLFFFFFTAKTNTQNASRIISIENEVYEACVKYFLIFDSQAYGCPL